MEHTRRSHRPEILAKMRADPSLAKGTLENSVIAECFEGVGKTQDASEVQHIDGKDAKLVITGGLRRDIGSTLFKKNWGGLAR